MAGSYLAVAEWEMLGQGEGEDVGGEVGGAGMNSKTGTGTSITTKIKTKTREEHGDWALAASYLEKVVGSNAPQRDKAEEMLRELRVMEARAVLG